MTITESAASLSSDPGEGFDVVTGAFSYSGSAITRALLGAGHAVRTLTGHPERRSDGSPVEVHPLDFDDVLGLTSSLEGARTLFNTYWVRFPRRGLDHEVAVRNSRTLFSAARDAGVERIVHVSITHPSITSPYPYFRGKAAVERDLADVGVPYSVLRPAILFGGDGVLLNNIAWLLRRLPIFGIGAGGSYRIRAIHIDDLAALALEASRGVGNEVIDAVGPERPTFKELVVMIRRAVGAHCLLAPVPGFLVPPMAGLLGVLLRDRLLTGEEFFAMADGLADSDGATTGSIKISDWIASQGTSLGQLYVNDTRRHFT